MTQTTIFKADIDLKLEKEKNNLSILKDAMNKSRSNTQSMLGILSSFENRLQKLESTIEPVYNETEMLRRRQENIEKTTTTLDNVLSYYHVAKEVESTIKEGPSTCGLEKYLGQMNRLKHATNYFESHNTNTTGLELLDVTRVFEDGKEVLSYEFRTLLNRHGRPVPPIMILDLIGDEELPATDPDVPLEHFPEKIVEDLGSIAKWLEKQGNTVEFTKDYQKMRGATMLKSLQVLREHLKTASASSNTSIQHIGQHSPAPTAKFSRAKDTPTRKSKLKIAIKKDAQFAHSRRVLEAKTKSLKSMGKGNKPNAAEPLTSEELKILREKGIIGTHNPSALLNLVWLNNSMFFGLRGRQDHVNMHWGDILLKKTSDGKEYLQFNERSTKTRSGVKVGDIRAVPPRAFAVEDDPYCPVNVYKEFRRHRPSDMCEHESRFYLRALVDPKTDVWYSRQTIGKDKLGQFMKNMAEEGKLEGRKVNHSGRKTFATSLLQSGKAVTEVAQLGGWKNIQSVTHYAVPSIQQQEDNSNIISNILRPNKSYASTCDNTNAEGTKSNPVSLTDTNNNATVIDLVPANNNATVIDLVPTFHTDTSADSVVEMSTSCAQMQSHTSEKKDNPMNLFQNAVISGGTININIIAGNSKKKNSSGHYLSSQTNEIVSSQEYQLKKKAQTALLQSPFDPASKGHRRQGSYNDMIENLDMEVEIYVTQLSALLKLMQSEAQLMNYIIPEKSRRSVFDAIVQQSLDCVVTEGEMLATQAKKSIGKHEFMSVLAIFPVVKHLRSIKPEFDYTLEGCSTPTRSKLASLLSTLGSTGAKALEDFIESIKNDPERASMPKDGTVHELTNRTIIFLEPLMDYAETAGAMLLMHGEQAAPSEAIDTKKSKLKLADYTTKVLSALGLNLSNKSETYSDPTLRHVFMLNNYNYILKSVTRSGLLNLIHLCNKDVGQYYEDQIHEQKRMYSESWSKVLHYILEIDEPLSQQRLMMPDVKLKEKEKQNIKDKFSGFNKELEEIMKIQKGYSIPDPELREALKKDNKDYIVPRYKMFLEKYEKINFTKNREKYIKYIPPNVSELIDRFFDTSA